MARMVTIKVKTSSKGDVSFKMLQKQFKELSSKNVTIGIFDAARTYPGSKATLGEVAMWQEFGTNPKHGPPIPSRSFLRTPFDKGIDKIVALKNTLLQQISQGKITVSQGLAVLGADGVRRIQTLIKRRIDPPLAPYTLEQRKKQGITGTTPLLATRFLFNSIAFAVRTNQEDR